MVGIGSKRDESLPTISSINIFTALESRKKKSSKKKSDKEKQQWKDSALRTSSVSGSQPTVSQAWAPTPVCVTSWADCEEDDDDYFAMPALPPLSSVEDEPCHQGAQKEKQEEDGEDQDEEDEDCLSLGEESEGYDEVDEGNEENKEPQPRKTNELHTGVNVVVAAREPDRQLSKKELKKKGLAELEAALAELGLNHNVEKGSDKIVGSKEGDTNAGVNNQVQKGRNVAEGKSSKRRKAKKEKSFKEGKEEDTEYHAGFSKDEKPALGAREATNDAGLVDKSEIMKKLTSMKKKKSLKDGDSAAKAGAAEAAVRAAKLAAAKKKEKNHYNQQPVR